ncbi:DUF3558 family protein [Gordonia sp. PKS22-38]|uniref:DUF3558 family protein n=1 Tax=Gordonia prachuapensis TaxID=3115651 RepID=A0ABU7MQV8_9ACTN|nr:DUF3558 family protein [Gordonia sp. PKS22-38]
MTRRTPMANSRIATLSLITLFALTACSTSNPSDSEDMETSGGTLSQNIAIRQTDDLGEPLPFETWHRKRWNSSNDGTSYEPCTAVTPSIASSLGLDPDSIADAATVDGQTLRGCEWHYAAEGMDNWSISQVVADYESLQYYKNRNESFDWMDDQHLNGRSIGVGSLNNGHCFSYVQSQDSGVMTAVNFSALPIPPLREICDRAIDLTRATIDQIPE